MEMVLDIYKKSYDAEFPVVNMDESPKQLIKETKQRIPVGRGRLAKYDYEYERCGVCNIFMASEALAGRRMVKITDRKTKKDWAEFIEDIENQYKDAKKITLIMDNLNTHKPGSLYEAFAPEKAKALWDRFNFVFTPKHGSWLNMAEIEINIMDRECLSRRIGNPILLEKEIACWSAQKNKMKAKIRWSFTREKADKRLSKYYVA